MNERRFSYDHDEMMREVSQLYPERTVKPLKEGRNQIIVRSALISQLLGSYGDDAATEDEVTVVQDS
jgi:hypothetical protein